MPKYCWSTDGEIYHGEFETPEEALGEASDTNPGRKSFYVGETCPPTQPELLWRAYDWLGYVSCHDEYSGEWAEDWDQSTPEQRDELEAEVRPILAAWLDRHGLRPKFFTVSNEVRYTWNDDTKTWEPQG